MAKEGFYTMKGYTLIEHGLITSSMEDYLEMICRLSEENEVVRISTLARALHVKPPSASKMAGNLRAQELIEFPKYGCITLTELGKRMGRYLMRRHELINRLLCLINGTTDELEEVEKIEHFLSPRTVESIERFLNKVEAAQ
ncbi:MAG: metal-dependent transcriptional regulator [Acutalibacter sp.]|nr:metal-dependent transcriptional regulator [Acutalibacter sp.]